MIEWGYDELSGPNEWPKHYQTGKLQSPINILVDFCALSGNSHHNHHHHHHHQQQQQQHNHRADYAVACCCTGGAGVVVSSLSAGLRRTHLDSIGEDEHQRSSSTSSSTSSSPVQNNTDSCGDDDDDEDLSDGPTSGAKHRTTATKYRSAATMTSCVDCFPSTPAPLAKGRSQRDQNTRHCVSNKKLFLGYPRYMSSSVQLCNTGHSWQINLPPELGAHTLLSGPPLGDREYRLAQVHAHWDTDDCNQGSEHQINGKSFAAEIHFVHWNCTNFRSLEEASKHKHGLAVLGVLVMALEGEQNKNKHLDKIVSALRHVKSPNSSTELRSKLDLKKLFPANRWSYASYEGSLTTPPLSEVVDWIVFLNPITCSTGQIEQFQQINCEPTSSGSHTKLAMKRNCRPVQPTNNRLVSIWTHPMTN